MTNLSETSRMNLDLGQEDTCWRKSSKSTFNGNCVEIGKMRNNSSVLVRDSKNPGPMLQFSLTLWTVFIDRAKRKRAQLS